MTHSMTSNSYDEARRRLAYDPASPTGLVWVLPGFKLNVGDVAGGWSGTYYKVKGLCFNKAQGAWMGQVQANGKRHTKSSVDRALVERWLIDKRKELHCEFTRHR